MEGWGNQFIEAVFAKLPAVVFEYPVWCSHLKQAGFDVVSLGSKLSGKTERGLVTVEAGVIRSAADEVVSILTSPQRRKAIGEHNYEVGRKNFGYDTLEWLIRELLGRAGV